MKIFLSLLFAMFLCSLAIAQNMRDVVQLKNGSIIKGIITEQTPPTQLKIQTADGSLFVYRYDEIEKITREDFNEVPSQKAPLEPPDLDSYGRIGIGAALGGGGIIGVPVRFCLNRKFVLEAGIYVRPTIIRVEKYFFDPLKGFSKTSITKTEFRMPPFIAGGIDYFLSENFKPKSGKIIKNGIMFRAGTTIGASYALPVESYNPYREYTIDSSFHQTMVAVGWARERFKTERKKSSYILELGVGFLKYSGINSQLGTLLDDAISIEPLIYWKFHWNFFLSQRKKQNE